LIGVDKKIRWSKAYPEILLFDEPSAGLDSVSAKPFDDLARDLEESLGITIVIVTRDLANISAIGTRAVY
jgi:phospholipid/cholesterol/gamma-HCH transport system ATP-binding protein